MMKNNVNRPSIRRDLLSEAPLIEGYERERRKGNRKKSSKKRKSQVWDTNNEWTGKKGERVSCLKVKRQNKTSPEKTKKQNT